ncbi:hypothetical protein MUN89_05745 [Halobacillus salinarum]|uniref:Uncharacterized protein n=1 Tax=Halobacillus salinarum TaxID=2932257 RepID=A0ABY4EM36_9BACI|nr:hypothetical protein [Halobacillus salinarum]UOQ45450.1 hypothetical protein MUN89_05745 [Halobacillus salinarum]
MNRVIPKPSMVLSDRFGHTLRFSRAAGEPPRAAPCGVSPLPSSRRSLRVCPMLA